MLLIINARNKLKYKEYIYFVYHSVNFFFTTDNVGCLKSVHCTIGVNVFTALKNLRNEVL